jgi:uncharacterized protein with HEPN domain
MQPNDKALLWDMKTAGEEIQGFINGISYSVFMDDKKTRYAIERQLLVIGEAANHVSDEFKEENPDIPWKRIIGLRNVLAHEYGDILIDRIWNICRNNIPELLDLIVKTKI